MNTRFHPDLVQRTYNLILEAIADGRLPAGSMLEHEAVAERLGVPWQSVLTALLMLKKDGFAVEAGRRGLMVAALDPRDVMRTYQVRGALESLAAREAARRVAAGHLVVDPVQLLPASIDGAPVAELVAADLKFHERILELADNPLIAEALGAQWRLIRRAMAATLQMPGRSEIAWAEHRALVRAIAAGDAEQAAQIARDHDESSGTVLAAALPAAAPEEPEPTPSPSATLPRLADRARALRAGR